MALCSMSVVGFAVFTTLGEESASTHTPAGEVPTELPSPSPEPSATIAQTPSPVPSATPFAPPNGWVEFESQGASIWLPPAFIGGDMTSKRQETVSLVTSQFNWSDSALEKIKNFGPETILLMVEKREGYTNPIFTNVTLYQMPDENQTDPADFLSTEIELVQNAVVFSRKKLTVSGYQARRIDFEYREGTAVHNATALAIRGNNAIWLVLFNFAPETQVEVGQVIETSIRTIALP